jgi:hypothetical protein
MTICPSQELVQIVAVISILQGLAPSLALKGRMFIFGNIPLVELNFGQEDLGHQHLMRT